MVSAAASLAEAHSVAQATSDVPSQDSPSGACATSELAVESAALPAPGKLPEFVFQHGGYNKRNAVMQAVREFYPPHSIR